MVKKRILLLIVILLGLPAYLWADGTIVMSAESAQLTVRATAQRAVLWQRDGVFEIHIMPVFERSKVKAAWVIPFPVLPKVSESSSDFFNQLEFLTAPMFVQGHYCPTGCSGDSTIEAEGCTDLVEVWEKGTVGALDYVIISADRQLHIVNWLRMNGYYVTPQTETSLLKFETEGTFFFAAKISENADPTKSLTPVRFVLPGQQTPVYPLVLTGLGVPQGASLALTLWVISPHNSFFLPSSHKWDSFWPVNEARDIEGYHQALNRFYLSHSPGTLALVYAAINPNSKYAKIGMPRAHNAICTGTETCFSFSEVDIKAPTWCPEVNEIIANQYNIFRYQGRLGPVNLEKDLVFYQAPEGPPVFPQNTFGFFKNCIEPIGPCR